MANQTRRRLIEQFWDTRACGSEHSRAPAKSAEFYAALDSFRYHVEPVEAFAEFAEWSGKDILEIGVGAGGDVSRFLKAGSRAIGIDISATALDVTRARLQLEGLPVRLCRADALSIPFPANSFDLVWSWGVLHHTPDITQAVREVLRVLRPGGVTKVMLYHRPSWVALAAWLRWGVLRGRPFQGLKRVVEDNVESPGTLALRRSEIEGLFAPFGRIETKIVSSYWDSKFVPVLGRLAGARMGWFALVSARKMSSTNAAAASDW